MNELVDLHRHLEGCVRPSTAYEFAVEHSPPKNDDWYSRFAASEREAGLLAYLGKIDNASELVRSLDDWRRVTREAILDAVDDGLTAVELRFAPRFIARMTGQPEQAVAEAICDVMTGHGLPIEVGAIGIVVRDEGPEAAVDQMRNLLRHPALVGVDIAGDEAGYPAELFAPAFDLAHDHGIAVTAHAGEAAGPESVWAALKHLRPSRIGHGVRSAEDPELMERLAADGVTLEVALTSNVQTRAAPSFEEHQLTTLTAAGVPVALCTDNPTPSRTRLSAEYRLATQLIGPEAVSRIRQHALSARFGS